MFSLAYVILPFTETAPADAIRASLARFQQGDLGELPDEWFSFDEDTEGVRRAHKTQFTFIDCGEDGLQVEGENQTLSYIGDRRVRDEMRRHRLKRWTVRFSDLMDIDTFYDRFGDRRLERSPVTGAYGQMVNSLGHWDWWDLGGRFDGCIVGEFDHRGDRGVAQISSGPHPGRQGLTSLVDIAGTAFGEQPVGEIDLSNDRNIELVATLLTDAQAGKKHAFPKTLILPPAAVEDRLRWLDSSPEPRPAETLEWLGLRADASWPEVTKATYARLQDHWAAGVAYHL